MNTKAEILTEAANITIVNDGQVQYRRPWGWLQCLCSAFRRRVLRLAQWANEKSDPDFEHGMMLAERCADIFAEHQRTWDGKDGEALNRACALHKAAADEFMAWHKTRKDRQAKDSATGPNASHQATASETHG